MGLLLYDLRVLDSFDFTALSDVPKKNEQNKPIKKAAEIAALSSSRYPLYFWKKALNISGVFPAVEPASGTPPTIRSTSLPSL